jgi:uncharacterized protein (DUF1778 family)
MPAEKPHATRTVVPVHLPEAAQSVIERAAAVRHKPRSAFMRDAAVAEANRILGIEPGEPADAPEPARAA